MWIVSSVVFLLANYFKFYGMWIVNQVLEGKRYNGQHFGQVKILGAFLIKENQCFDVYSIRELWSSSSKCSKHCLNTCGLMKYTGEGEPVVRNSGYVLISQIYTANFAWHGM